MIKSSIIYCTNNLLPPLLFEKTLNDAHQHAVKNDSELIISSQFPVLKDFTQAKELCDFTIDKNHDVYKRIIQKELCFTCSRNFVFGRMPYSLETIFEQMYFAIEKAETDNIVIMEHDCLYPDNYVEVMCDLLKKRSLAYTVDAKIYLNFYGYFSGLPSITMSCVAWKKDLALKVLERKMKLFPSRDSSKPAWFEPVIYSESDLEKKPLLRVMLERDQNDETKDIPVTDNICADKIFMSENKVVMDIKHGLNQSGYIKTDEKGQFQDHPYWGKAEEYVKLFSAEDCNNLKYWYGVKVF